MPTTKICRCRRCGESFSALVSDDKRDPTKCPPCRRAVNREYARKFRQNWHKKPPGMPTARNNLSFLSRLALMQQKDVANRFGVTSRAVYQSERRALTKLFLGLKADPAALVEINEDFARRHLTPEEFAVGMRTRSHQTISIGPRLLNVDQREELLHWQRLVDQYHRDGDHEKAQMIAEEINDLKRRVSSISDKGLSRNFD